MTGTRTLGGTVRVFAWPDRKRHSGKLGFVPHPDLRALEQTARLRWLYHRGITAYCGKI